MCQLILMIGHPTLFPSMYRLTCVNAIMSLLLYYATTLGYFTPAVTQLSTVVMYQSILSVTIPPGQPLDKFSETVKSWPPRAIFWV